MQDGDLEAGVITRRGVREIGTRVPSGRARSKAEEISRPLRRKKENTEDKTIWRFEWQAFNRRGIYTLVENAEEIGPREFRPYAGHSSPRISCKTGRYPSVQQCSDTRHLHDTDLPHKEHAIFRASYDDFSPEAKAENVENA